LHFSPPSACFFVRVRHLRDCMHLRACVGVFARARVACSQYLNTTSSYNSHHVQIHCNRCHDASYLSRISTHRSTNLIAKRSAQVRLHISTLHFLPSTQLLPSCRSHYHSFCAVNLSFCSCSCLRLPLPFCDPESAVSQVKMFPCCGI
jgi:hypothetical protein